VKQFRLTHQGHIYQITAPSIWAAIASLGLDAIASVWWTVLPAQTPPEAGRNARGV